MIGVSVTRKYFRSSAEIGAGSGSAGHIVEVWQDYRTGKAKDLGEVWSLEKNGRQARCVLQGHPLGTEALVFVDDELQRAEAFRDQRSMLERTTAWREMFEKGWRALR